MKLFVKQFFQWSLACTISFIICNLFMFIYYKPVGWIDRTNSATTSIWAPGTTLVNGIEGYGRYVVDKKGYLNKELPLADEYTLIVGSSHVQGKEVLLGERYSDILNSKLCQSEEELVVYNCSQDGLVLPDIIKNFYAITQEFPGAKNIVIDVGKVEFAKERWEDALVQCEFDETQLGENIFTSLSLKKKLVMKVKECVPLLSVLKKQWNTYHEISMKKEDAVESTNCDTASFAETLNAGFEMIRSQYGGDIYVLYHPRISINIDGTLSIVEEKYVSHIKACCELNDIVWLDASEAFIDEYEYSYSVPYGFNNTAMGEGHLNVNGHKVIAEKLYEKMEGTRAR